MLAQQSSAAAFRKALLGRTIRHAAETTSFYLDLYRGIALDRIWQIADLEELPVINKALIREAADAARSQSCSTSFLQNTSGTSGPILVLHRSMEEQEFISAFFSEFFKDSEPQNFPVQLALVTADHGTVFRIPVPVYVIEQSVFDDRSAGNAAHMLFANHNLGGIARNVQIVTGSLSQVTKFTQFLLYRGIDPAAANIRLINLTGDYLTQNMRKFLEETWKSTINSRYSQSEIFGGASSSAKVSRGFSFDLHVVPEVVTPEGRQIRNGCGRLLLTSLYPFVQRQPLVRYDTGDIFACTQRDDDETEYIFYGRHQHCLWHSRGLALPSVAILDALDSSPLCYRSPTDTPLSMLDPTAESSPQFIGYSVEHNDSLSIRLATRLRVDPLLYFRDAVAELDAILRRIIHNSWAAPFCVLQELSGTIELHVLPPNSSAAGTFEKMDLNSRVWLDSKADWEVIAQQSRLIRCIRFERGTLTEQEPNALSLTLD